MECLNVYKILCSVCHINYCMFVSFPIFFRTYNVFIPKFSIKTSYSLNAVLTEMGMTDMFGDHADLSGIAEGQKLAVSEVRVEYVIAQNFPIFCLPRVLSSSSRLYTKLPLMWMRLEPPLQQLQASASCLCLSAMSQS